MVSIWDAYVSLRQALTDIGVEEAELEARVLVAFALHGQAKHAARLAGTAAGCGDERTAARAV